MLPTEPAQIDNVRFFSVVGWYNDLRFSLGDCVRVKAIRGHDRNRHGAVVGINLALYELQGLPAGGNWPTHRLPRPYQVRLEELRAIYRFHESDLAPCDIPGHWVMLPMPWLRRTGRSSARLDSPTVR